jgi:hypothetical protein
VRPKEAQTDSVERFVNTHVPGGGSGMICGEDITTEGKRHNNQHQKLGVILDWLEDDDLMLKEGKSVWTDVIAIHGMDRRNVCPGESGGEFQMIHSNFGARVKLVGGCPIEG